MLALECRYLGADQRPRRWLARWRGRVDCPVPAPEWSHAFVTMLTVLPHPVEDRPVSDPNFARHHVGWHAFFQVQLHRAAFDLVCLRPRILMAIGTNRRDFRRVILAHRAAPSSPPR